jgi:hypothetical protein
MSIAHQARIRRVSPRPSILLGRTCGLELNNNNRGNHQMQNVGEYLTVFLRFLTDDAGRILQCELLTLEGRSLGRFRKWKGALAIIHAWLGESRRM